MINNCCQQTVMASRWWETLGNSGKFATLVGSGAVLSFAVYGAYRYKQIMDASYRDEGFVDLAKVCWNILCYCIQAYMRSVIIDHSSLIRVLQIGRHRGCQRLWQYDCKVFSFTAVVLYCNFFTCKLESNCELAGRSYCGDIGSFRHSYREHANLKSRSSRPR